jgi:hypothetical protein
MGEFGRVLQKFFMFFLVRRTLEKVSLTLPTLPNVV